MILPITELGRCSWFTISLRRILTQLLLEIDQPKGTLTIIKMIGIVFHDRIKIKLPNKFDF